MSFAVMAEGSCTHSVLNVSTASSLMVLLSVTDFSDRGAAKPNSTCLQCTWFFLSQGSIAASFGYKSACSRTSFLMKRPIKVSKRSFNDCPKKGAIGASVWNLSKNGWSCFATEMKNFSLVTVSGSSHASLIVAYEAVCGAFLGVARKDETYFSMLGHIWWALSATTTSSTHLWGQNFRGNTVDPVSLTKSSRRAGVSWNSCHNDRMRWPSFQPDSFTPYWRPPWTIWSPQLPIFRSGGSSSELRSFVRSV